MTELNGGVCSYIDPTKSGFQTDEEKEDHLFK